MTHMIVHCLRTWGDWRQQPSITPGLVRKLTAQMGLYSRDLQKTCCSASTSPPPASLTLLFADLRGFPGSARRWQRAGTP